MRRGRRTLLPKAGVSMKSSLPRMVMMVMLIIAVAVVISTVSFTVFYFMIMNRDTSQPDPDNLPHLPVTTVLRKDMGYITTDLADGKFIQVSIVLQYPELTRSAWFGLRQVIDDSLPLALEEYHAEIRASIFSYLRTQISTNIRGSNEDRIRAEIVARINSILPTEFGITGVIFNDLVIT